MKKIFQMSAKTFYGFEDILCEELKKINAIDIIKSNRIVHFKGDKELMYKANLCLRTALKILIPLKNKKVINYEALYKFAFDFEWENYFHKDSSFCILMYLYEISSFFIQIQFLIVLTCSLDFSPTKNMQNHHEII